MPSDTAGGATASAAAGGAGSAADAGSAAGTSGWRGGDVGRLAGGDGARLDSGRSRTGGESEIAWGGGARRIDGSGRLCAIEDGCGRVGDGGAARPARSTCRSRCCDGGAPSAAFRIFAAGRPAGSSR
ncbi:MAG: hypothetical protein AB7S46_09235, partial [Flavobacteriaceae bacterium]